MADLSKSDLERFCSDDISRPSLSAPWSSGDYSYASNGHLIVRVPRMVDIAESDVAPKVAGMFDKHMVEPPEWFALSDIELPEMEIVDCATCEGGEESVHDCPDCSCICEDCNDTGKVEEIIRVKVGMALYQLKYLLMLKGLPNCKLGPTGEWTPAPFRFDGGDGLLMPMRSFATDFR